MEKRLERFDQVRARVGNVSRATLYRWIQEDQFPAPVSLRGRSVAWDSSAVDRWITQRIAQGPRIHDIR